MDQIKFYRIIKMGGGGGSALKLSLVPLSGGENLSLYVQDFFKRELKTTFKLSLCPSSLFFVPGDLTLASNMLTLWSQAKAFIIGMP